jgi:hypothetical protein
MDKENTIQEILQAERAWAQALFDLDLTTIDQLTADEYGIIQPGGVVVDKTETLASLRSAQRHWDVAYSTDHRKGMT